MKSVVIEWDTHSGKKDRIVYREVDLCPACGKPETDHCWQDKATRRWTGARARRLHRDSIPRPRAGFVLELFGDIRIGLDLLHWTFLAGGGDLPKG